MAVTLAPSRPLEEARPFPAGHCFVELALLRREEVQVVLDHIRAEGRARQLTALQLAYRLAQRARHLRQIGGLIDVPLEDGRRLDPVLDAVQAGGDRGRVGQVRVRVGARDAALGAQGGAVADANPYLAYAATI